VCIYFDICGNGSAMHPMPLKTILLLHNIFSLAAEKRDQLTHQNTKGYKNTLHQSCPTKPSHSMKTIFGFC